MKYFRYCIKDDEIRAFMGEIDSVPYDYLALKSLSTQELHYKIVEGKITDVIAEGSNENAARRRADEFISSLNVSLV